MSVKFETTRPLDALDKVGIADLAIYTPMGQADTAQAVDQVLRAEWQWEIDHGHGLEFLDWRKGRIVFKDGSMITFKAKAFRG